MPSAGQASHHRTGDLAAAQTAPLRRGDDPACVQMASYHGESSRVPGAVVSARCRANGHAARSPPRRSAGAPPASHRRRGRESPGGPEPGRSRSRCASCPPPAGRSARSSETARTAFGDGRTRRSDRHRPPPKKGDQCGPHRMARAVARRRDPREGLHAVVFPERRKPERIERARLANRTQKIGIEGRENVIGDPADQPSRLPCEPATADETDERATRPRVTPTPASSVSLSAKGPLWARILTAHAPVSGATASSSRRCESAGEFPCDSDDDLHRRHETLARILKRACRRSSERKRRLARHRATPSRRPIAGNHIRRRNCDLDWGSEAWRGSTARTATRLR